MELSNILKVLLIVEIVVLLGNAMVISRDYQDSWILEGLEIPFIIFAITYTITFFKEKRVSWMVTLAVICSSVLVLIPNLKYVWFYGRSIDQHGSYSFVNQIYFDGYITDQYKNFAAAEIYASIPLMPLSFAIFTIILNIPAVYSMKILPVLWAPIYPLLTYSIVKKLKLAKGTQISKYALFISSLPARAGLTYTVTGSTFGNLLVFLVLFQIVRLLQDNDRRHWTVLLFFIFALAGAHATSSILLAILLSTIALLQNISATTVKTYLKNSAMIATILTVAWLVFSQSTKALETIVNTLSVSISGITGAYYPTTGYIPSRFFELLFTDIFGAVRSLVVYNGRDIFLLLLTIAGLIFVLKTKKQTDYILKFFVLFILLLLLSLTIGVLLKVGGGYWQRGINFATILFPIFSSIFIAMYIRKRAWIPVVIFSLIILLTTLQFYSCQPLIPRASILSKDLPTDEPLVYVVRVNSIYQRQMIKFAEKYVQADLNRIASDRVTRNQIMGLTGVNFTYMVAWHYPLTNVEFDYDYFLIHLPGKSGGFQEQAEYRTRDLILDIINNSTIAYTNGESYVLLPRS